jgi:hypothetical protein
MVGYTLVFFSNFSKVQILNFLNFTKTSCFEHYTCPLRSPNEERDIASIQYESDVTKRVSQLSTDEDNSRYAFQVSVGGW